MVENDLISYLDRRYDELKLEHDNTETLYDTRKLLYHEMTIIRKRKREEITRKNKLLKLEKKCNHIKQEKRKLKTKNKLEFKISQEYQEIKRKNKIVSAITRKFYMDKKLWYYRIWMDCKSRNMERYKIELDFPADYILDLYNKQNGRCIYFDIPLDINARGQNSFKPSIDRIDSDKPYSIDNVCLCSMVANLGKSNMNYEDWLLVCKMIQTPANYKDLKFENFTPNLIDNYEI